MNVLPDRIAQLGNLARIHATFDEFEVNYSQFNVKRRDHSVKS